MSWGLFAGTTMTLRGANGTHGPPPDRTLPDPART
jgi:hypothetical protein